MEMTTTNVPLRADHDENVSPAPNARASTEVDTGVGLQVKVRRLELGMSQESVARRLGITPQQLQKYERGTNRIGASRLFQLSQILNLPIQNFFKGPSSAAENRGPEAQAEHELNGALEDAATVRLLRQFALVRNDQLKNRVIKLVETVIHEA